MHREIEYIFSINTGRAGSTYLQRLFDQAEGCRAYHEPLPKCHDKVMRSYYKGRVEEMEACVKEKIAWIKEVKDESEVYVETSQCFIKGFGWLLPNYIPEEKIGIVVLKRDESKIVETFSRLHCFPLSPRGRKWLIPLDAKKTIIRPPVIFMSVNLTYRLARFIRFIIVSYYTALYCVKKISLKKTAFLSLDEMKEIRAYSEDHYPGWLKKYEQECLFWYVNELYSQGEVFRKKYPKMKYYEVNIDELNSLESVHKMFSFFGLSAKNGLADITGKRVNSRK